MRTKRVVVIGAGIGGLVVALELAAKGLSVIVLERAAGPGGKMREITIGGSRIDAGPTVFTMRWVFEEIFADAGTSLADHVTLRPANVLARHAWSRSERLDLYSDLDRSANAIGTLAGAAEARGFRQFCERARKIYQTLEGPFIRSAQPTPVSLVRDAGMQGLGDLWRISPFTTLWRALGDHFRDPRLRQLFGRYATYCGSSPFLAPATLMLVAHVEQQGVWLVEGGMHFLAKAIATLAAERGAAIRYETEVAEVRVRSGRAVSVALTSGEEIEADAIVVNADASAVATGRLGRAVAHSAPAIARNSRSLSAMTWASVADTSGFPLVRHNVFFSDNYAAEFDDIFRRHRLPQSPTVYVCAQDRDDEGALLAAGGERLLCLVNAPANGDTHAIDASEIRQCEERTFGLLARCGLQIERRPETTVLTTPREFERLYPATGGALYGQASHGWTASFSRPQAKTRLPGLYLAGGSAHPGPGVPMAALSGRLAALSVLGDLTSGNPSPRAGMRGGTSTR